jgi:hypothetical protein
MTSKKLAINFYILLIVCIFLSLIALLPRLEGENVLGKFLWAEDGNIFINQVTDFGLRSLWIPYAGYLHTYPRLVTLLGSYFNLENQVYILLAGWITAYCLMVAVVVIAANNLEISPIFTLIAIILISLQPNSGEVFFNITNSQWMLGVALSIYLAVLPYRKMTFGEFVILAILCLTGPFSILMTPIILLQNLKNRKFKENFWLYAVVVICALIQVSVLICSDRVAAGSTNLNLIIWIKALLRLMMFSTIKNTTFLLAATFWFIFIIASILHPKNLTEKVYIRKKISFLLLIIAVVNILAALYSSKIDPMAIVFSSSGNRYTWIPYSLIILSAVLVTFDFKWLRLFLVTCIVLIFYDHFHIPSMQNLQFSSYANFARQRDVIIPIQPLVPNFPGFYIKGIAQNGSRNQTKGNQIKYDLIDSHNVEIAVNGNNVKINAKTNDPYLIFNDQINCMNATDIGIDIELIREADGWLQLFWNESKEFTENKSLRRFYPMGKIKAQFAFPFNDKPVFIRFDPLEKTGHAEITSLQIYCLP